MKKLSLLIVAVLCYTAGFGQAKSVAVCHSPTQQFAMLASDKKFVRAHPNPRPFHFQSSIGKTINYPCADGKTADAYELKAKKPTNNYLLVVHEWYGLNDFIKQEAEKLYNDIGNVNVIALDLYDGNVATNSSDAGKYMAAVKEDRAVAIIKGAIAYAGPKARIATIGWCFGGGWSLQTTLLAGKQAIGCVMYYGMPENDLAKLKTLNTDVLGIFGNKDKWINPKVVATFADNMKKDDKKLTLYQYDADHGFANPSNPIYNADATKDAYMHTIAFLKPRMK
ncbi:dienelactone hydrolase [Mucilaginibacter sp. PPCGB 2223]|uniref:dienelactone hydrolase family protein n=1 Tax=Mucilaginibacter sp. PPCGB 2223 TaxID=1886027 RepID=UPI000825E8B9|nr:dienelactone hydrolase family protein [Mucilaginibacter sp. PPCGB 2223]OCX50297.1 dienelactone hydrolase [Mucilaginibacter sp. PPCGB 2223]